MSPGMRKIMLFAACAIIVTLAAPEVSARDWYVSVKRGRGKKGSKKKPAKDLGNILKKLKPGDTVHIAEGVYLGRGKRGSATVSVPVKIIGGYSDDFSKRDPWGAHRTILFGNNKSKNYTADPALFVDLAKYTGPAHPIVVDGLIIDHAGRNRYKTGKELKLVLSANPKTGQNPSPSLGGLVVRVSKSGRFDRGPRWDITVKNNIVMNTHQNQAALSVSGYKGSKIAIENNLVIQHSGTGILCGSKYAGATDLPTFKVSHNTVLFSWDSGMSQGFNIGFDRSVNVAVTHNVFGFADIYAVWNGKNTKNVLFSNNLVTGARKGDYLEFNTVMNVEDMVDEAENLHEDSDENVTDKIRVPVSKAFAKAYGARVIVDRAKAEADIKASNSGANALRGMLGLPLRAGSVKWPSGEINLNRISVDDAIAAGAKMYAGHGCRKPAGS